jgi:hypothetical protein
MPKDYSLSEGQITSTQTDYLASPPNATLTRF